MQSKDAGTSVNDNTVRLFAGKDMKDIGYRLIEIGIESIQEKSSW